jgi:hypothetical protein
MVFDCISLYQRARQEDETKRKLAWTTSAIVLESSWNVMAHGVAPEGKRRGNWRMEWVASTLHTTSEHGVSSITTADAHTSATSSRLNWRPRRLKMDSSVSPKDEIWFLHVCHHISNAVYRLLSASVNSSHSLRTGDRRGSQGHSLARHNTRNCAAAVALEHYQELWGRHEISKLTIQSFKCWGRYKCSFLRKS